MTGAITNPTPERYIDPEMTEESIRHRMGEFVESDWKRLANERWLQLRMEGTDPVSPSLRPVLLRKMLMADRSG